MIGIPMTILAIIPLIIAIAKGPDAWYLAALALFVVGYSLQFIGHAVEGNDAGETILVKKLLGGAFGAAAHRPVKPIAYGCHPSPLFRSALTR